jgi:hypothetical protein
MAAQTCYARIIPANTNSEFDVAAIAGGWISRGYSAKLEAAPRYEKRMQAMIAHVDNTIESAARSPRSYVRHPR